MQIHLNTKVSVECTNVSKFGQDVCNVPNKKAFSYVIKEKHFVWFSLQKIFKQYQNKNVNGTIYFISYIA